MKKKKKNSSRKTTTLAVRAGLFSIVLAVAGFGWWAVLSSNDDPALSPDPSELAAAEQLAQRGVTSNAEWQSHVIERDFDGYSMVLVPAGSFLMGSTEAEYEMALDMCIQSILRGEDSCAYWLKDEVSAQIITIDAPFWLDRTEVTRAMYAECVKAGACTETPEPANYLPNEPDYPINQVTWFQAVDFCAWRAARLPTEVEWEYAARGPDHLIFPWGDTTEGTEANYADQNFAAVWGPDARLAYVEYDDGYLYEAPVGSYPQGVSWVGALDMAGNVSEWTATFYPDPLYSIDGDGRAIRGGDSGHVLSLSRTAMRAGLPPGDYSYAVGFRCARSWD